MVQPVKMPTLPAAQMAGLMVERILEDLPFARGDDVAVLISGLGATPVMEQYVLFGHVDEMLRAGMTPKEGPKFTGEKSTSQPYLFLKASSCLAGARDDIEIPRDVKKVDWEAEIACVIAKPGKHIKAERALDRIEGRTEWSVKAYSDPSARPAPAMTTDDSSSAGAAGEGAGRAYLMQRRAATQRREQTAQEDARIAEELHAELAGLATVSQRLAPQDPKLSGYTGVMVLNGT